MKDGRDIRHTFDRDGNTWLTDANGTIVRDDRGERIPGPADIEDPNAAFPLYESSRGHCAFCGRLICRGTCFK